MRSTQGVDVEPELEVSAHAERRAQQRGVSMDALLLAARYGDRSRGKAGVVIRSGTQRAVQRMVRQGVPASDADRARGVVLVVAEDSQPPTVITVRPKWDWRVS